MRLVEVRTTVRKPELVAVDYTPPVSEVEEPSYLKEFGREFKRQTIGQIVPKEKRRLPTLKEVVIGAGEGVETIVRGMAGFAAGTLTGLSEPVREFVSSGKITPESFAAARKVQTDIMEAVGKQPTTGFGTAISTVAASPFETAHSTLDSAVEGLSEEQQEASHYVLDLLIGGVGLRGGAKARLKKPTLKEVVPPGKARGIKGKSLLEQKPETVFDTAAPRPLETAKPRPLEAITKKGAKKGIPVMELIKRRRVDIDIGILESEAFIRKFENKLSKQELEAIPFIRQKIKDPTVLKQIGKEKIIPIIENPSAKVLKATEEIGKYYDEGHAFLSKHWDGLSYIEDYVTHIWDIPTKRRSEVVNNLSTKNPFLKKRTIPSLEEGIKHGLKPKTTNIAEILRIYDQYKIKTVHNAKFAESLKGLKDETGNPLIMRVDKAPEDWVTINHPALNRAMVIGKPKDVLLMQKVPVKVHPEIAKELNIIFDKPFRHPVIGALETVNAFTKKSMLSFSFFHHFALTESAFSSGIGLKTVKLWNPYKILKAVKKKDYAIYKNMPLAKDAIEHGVSFGALSDVQRGKIQTAFQTAERNAKMFAPVVKILRKGNELWDASLWDYYHNNLKLYAYEEGVLNGLKYAQKKTGRALTKQEISSVKTEMGQFVNDSFGGQNWELGKIMGDPKIRQMAHWLLLAPDWTISTLKQAYAPIRGVKKIATAKTPAELAGGRALTRQGGLFWIRAAAYFNLIAQSVNYYNTKKEYGEGRFTWENAPGNTLNIFFGKNDDGTERYIRMGKQFREVLEWGLEPDVKFGAKLSPILGESYRQVARHSAGSGFPTEWADMGSWESILPRIKSIGEMPLPFSLRPYIKDKPQMFMFALPSKKGMTNYKTKKLLLKELKAGNAAKIQFILSAALQNDLDAKSLLKEAQSMMKREVRYDEKKVAIDIRRELRAITDIKAKIDLLKFYVESGIMNPVVKEELNKILDREERVKVQKIKYDIK